MAAIKSEISSGFSFRNGTLRTPGPWPVDIHVQYNTIQYKFICMAAISWIKRKTITHKQKHAFKAARARVALVIDEAIDQR